MRTFFKLLFKLAMFAAILMLSAGGLRKGAGLFNGRSGGGENLIADGGQVTKEESDLTGTVFKSALRLVSGQASKTELASELNEKLYGQRGDPSDMAELGIDLGTSKEGSPVPPKGENVAGSKPAAKTGDTTELKIVENSDGKPVEQPAAGTATGTAAAQKAASPTTKGASPVSKLLQGPELVTGKSKEALGEIWQRMKQYSVELAMVPVVFIGMVWWSRSRRRKREAGFVPDFMATLPESDSETYFMKHRMDSLSDEEFELVVAIIYQRQGYRISLPAALASGRSSRFKLARKSERLLAQCHNFKNSHRVEVELVRELHEAMADANVTGGLFVASCGYTWDARHFAKTRNIKLISAKTMDALLTQARATKDEDLLAISPWISKFLTKVEMTTPRCPECEAEMDEIKEGDGSVWLCNQRPECGGRRDARKYRKGLRVAAQNDENSADNVVVHQPAKEVVAPEQSEPIQQSRGKESAQMKAVQPGEIAGVVSTPSATRDQSPVLPATTQEATLKPAPVSSQRGGWGTSDDGPKPESIVRNWKRYNLTEILESKPGQEPDPVKGPTSAARESLWLLSTT